MAAMHVKSQAGAASVIPMLMGMRQRSTTFIVDTSEGMSAMLGPVKNLLIQALLAKASLRDSLFNIISYSYKVTKWQPVCVSCAPDTVFEALGWVHSLSTCPGSDLLTALEAALSDPQCHSVHLLTSALPDHPELFLRGLSSFTSRTLPRRPVHVFFLSHRPELDSRTLDFLQCLTSATGGSCRLLLLGSTGSIDKVSMLFAVDNIISDLSSSVDSGYSSARPQTPAAHATPVSTHIVHQGNAFSPVVTLCGADSVAGCSLFYPGCRVLARREQDGLYYLGTITQQILDHRGVFLVEFDQQDPVKPPPPESSSTCSAPHQLVCPPDMVHHTRAHAHSLMPGDALLVPWGPDLRRYGPGRVLTGCEPRDPLRVALRTPLRLLFWNGVETSVPPELAVWISPSQYEHIVRQLQHPPIHTTYTQHSPYAIHTLHTPHTLLHTTTHCGPPTCCHVCSAVSCYCYCCSPNHPAAAAAFHCHGNRCPATPLRSLGLPGDAHFLSEGRSQREELDRKVELQLRDLVNTSPLTPMAARPPLLPCPDEETQYRGDEEEEEEEEEQGGKGKLELVSQAVNTDRSFLSRTRSGYQERPSWRYWRRSPAEPNHKKPGLVVTTTRSAWPLSVCSPELLPTSVPVMNQSSVFDKIPGSAGRKATIQEIFRLTQTTLPTAAGQ
ncbi:uncharacterized protein C11orf16 homolog [Engraulis encrasicolus]|uniref:uncharacterized protein C11orf16 homolog n=1 Tax=Engraulis encrasicolus TaxID=184585 RepID=UPI002FCF98E0